MLVREACGLKVEQKRAIIGVAMCSMEFYGLFSISTYELKTLLHASLDAFGREEIWHVCLIVYYRLKRLWSIQCLQCPQVMVQLQGAFLSKKDWRCASFFFVTSAKKNHAKRSFFLAAYALENVFPGILGDFLSPFILTKTRCFSVHQLHLLRHVGTYIQIHIHK